MEQSLRRDVIYMAIMSAVVLLLLIYTCRYMTPVYPEAGTGEYRLEVFGTSDIHGTIVDSFESPDAYPAAYIADKVNEVRTTEEGIDCRRAVLVDAGDIYQGNAISYLGRGEAMSAAFDTMEYDAVAVGNHEFDWGIDTVIDDDQTMRDYTLDGKSCQNSIPVVCCNLYQNGKKFSSVHDYVILDKTAIDESGETLDVRVAVIGFVEDYSDSIPADDFKNLGFSIVEDFDEVNRIASSLEESDECDATILLAHGDAKRLAESLGSSSDIDLVVGGHLHEMIAGETDWGLRYMAPTGSASSYMRSDLVFENDGNGGAQLRQDAGDFVEVIDLLETRDKQIDTAENDEELDREIVDIGKEYKERTDAILSEELGYVTVSVNRDPYPDTDRRASTEFNFVMDALRSACGADVAFMNISGIRGGFKLAPGEERHAVTLGDIYAMVPFDDNVVCLDLTGEELVEVINYSYRYGGWSLLTSMSGLDCYFIEDPDDDGSSEYPAYIPETLVMDGEVIYTNGKLKDEWKDKKFRIAIPAYPAIANRNGKGVDNPLNSYVETDRLVSNDMLVRDAVLEAIRREAAENDGYIPVDTSSHFIHGTYDGDRN